MIWITSQLLKDAPPTTHKTLLQTVINRICMKDRHNVSGIELELDLTIQKHARQNTFPSPLRIFQKKLAVTYGTVHRVVCNGKFEGHPLLPVNVYL
ncbi:hypothetical protein D3C76_268410 [compost metagenome]